MKCPTCGTWTEVLESRLSPEGRRRRYECANQHRFTTQEVVRVDTRSARDYAICHSQKTDQELAALHKLSRSRINHIRRQFAIDQDITTWTQSKKPGSTPATALTSAALPSYGPWGNMVSSTITSSPDTQDGGSTASASAALKLSTSAGSSTCGTVWVNQSPATQKPDVPATSGNYPQTVKNS